MTAAFVEKGGKRSFAARAMETFLRGKADVGFRPMHGVLHLDAREFANTSSRLSKNMLFFCLKSERPEISQFEFSGEKSAQETSDKINRASS